MSGFGLILERVFFCVLTIFLLFNIKFKVIPSTFIIASSILLLMAIFYFCKGYKYKLYNVHIILLYVFTMISFSLSWALNSDSSPFPLLQVMVAIFLLITIIPYVYFSYFRDRELDILMYISLSGIINAILIIAMFLNLSIKEFYLSLLSSNDLELLKGEIDLNTSLYSLRMIGFKGSATYGMAVTQIILTYIYIYYTRLKEQKIGVTFNICVCLLLVSAILSGRTGIIGVSFILLYLLYILQLKDIIKIILTFICICICIFFIAELFLSDIFYNFFQTWILELFSKGVKVDSLQDNFDMYIYTLEDFSMFGDFKLNNLDQTYYMNTDVGWYRILFAVGFFGTSIFFLFLIRLLNIRMTLSLHNITSICIGVFLIIVMFKGLIIFDFYMVFFLLTVVYSLNKIHEYQ